uniref:Uncharacterized protein n=1 Tax=Oryza glaberrima TaxID=4538 RepID=I1QU71_ORYGL
MPSDDATYRPTSLLLLLFRPWRLPLVRDVSMLCRSRVAGEHEEAEGEVPDRPVRAGSQGRRRRRWAGRVAQPRRHDRLRRRHHRRADHRQRRAPERGADVTGADGGAGAHRGGRRRHRVPHLPVGVEGLIGRSPPTTQLLAAYQWANGVTPLVSVFLVRFA